MQPWQTTAFSTQPRQKAPSELDKPPKLSGLAHGPSRFLCICLLVFPFLLFEVNAPQDRMFSEENRSFRELLQLSC